MGTGDVEHLLGRIDAGDLAAVDELVRERERGLPEPAADVEQTLTTSEAQLVPLPRPQPARRIPARRLLHGRNEHGGVRITIHPGVAQSVRLLRRHGASLRPAFRRGPAARRPRRRAVRPPVATRASPRNAARPRARNAPRAPPRNAGRAPPRLESPTPRPNVTSPGRPAPARTLARCRHSGPREPPSTAARRGPASPTRGASASRT